MMTRSYGLRPGGQHTVRKIELRAGSRADGGYGLTETHDTMVGAKKRAKYVASAEFAKVAEMSEPFAFVGLFVNDKLEWEV